MQSNNGQEKEVPKTQRLKEEINQVTDFINNIVKDTKDKNNRQSLIPLKQDS